MAKSTEINLSSTKELNFPASEYAVAGIVLDPQGKPIANQSILLYAKLTPKKGEGNIETMPLGHSKTDSLGNFTVKIANISVDSAYITVGKHTNSPLPLQVTNGTIQGKSILVLKTEETNADEDCGCHGKEIDRLPEMEDLVGNSNYSQDIGGGCTNFTTPNRALEEFSYFRIVRTTDPQIITPYHTQRLFNIDEAIRKLQRELAEMEKELFPVIYSSDTKRTSGAGTAKKGVPVAPKEQNAKLGAYEAKEQTLLGLEDEKRKLIAGLETRKELSVANMLDWDDSPTTYQNASIAHGHILEFRQVWRADGYSMGDLLYSLPLAPGQKRQIAVFDWDRSDTATRLESQEQREELENEQSRDRDISEIVSSVLNESQQANSNVKGKTTSWGVGVSVSTPTPVSVGVSGSFSMSNTNMTSNASQESSRDLAASSLQQIKDKTMQKASSVRSARSTVIQSVNQGESFNATTEFVANYNHCHALTIQYFEVLRHFAVNNELADVRECLFIPLPITSFNDEKVVRWQDILYRAVPDRTLKTAFASVERYHLANDLNKADAYAGIPNTRFADERMQSLSVRLELEMHIARPQEIYPSNILTFSQFFAQLATNGAQGVNIFNQDSIVKAYQREIANQLINNQADITNWQNTLGFLNGWQEIRRRVLQAEAEQRDAVFAAEMRDADWMNQYIKNLVYSIHLPQLNNLKWPVSPTKKFKILSRKNSAASKMRGTFSEEITIGITNLDMSSTVVNRGLITGVEICHTSLVTPGKLPAGSIVRVKNGNMPYTSANYSGSVFTSLSSVDNIANGEIVSFGTPLTEAEITNPRSIDIKKRDTLLKHLNANLEAYHHWIFYMMSPDRRYMLLDGLQIKVPGYKIPGTNTTVPDEMRSVASVVENRVIGVVGNNMIVPVAAGYNLDPRFRWDNSQVTLEDGTKVSALMYHYMPDRGFKSTPFRISVPTKGVFAEAIMGACNSCEKIDNSRFWKWEEHPIPDSPTAIGTIDSGSRYQSAGDLTAKDFAQALISLKDPLNAPDPTGLNTALNNIVKGDSFRDLTNLQGLNELAKQGLISNGEAAKAYAENATKLAEQQANLKNSDSIVSQINNSRLPKEQRDKLMEEHLRKTIGGKEEPTEKETQQQNNVDKAVQRSQEADKGKIKLKNPDGTEVEAEFENKTANDNIELQEPPELRPGEGIVDETIAIDFNDPDFLQQRQAIDQALADLGPQLQSMFPDNSSSNTNFA